MSESLAVHVVVASTRPERKGPAFRQYEHAHTKAWSALVHRADCFVFVTPEYDYSGPPSLINALDDLAVEWAYKPVGFVSYGRWTRALQPLRQPPA